MSSTVISVENLSKSYRLGQIGTGTLTNDLKLWWARLRGKPNPLLKIGHQDYGNQDGETVWALKDVSFQVAQGEVLGIIGRNGAGKSTLLKILSRVTASTNGQVKVKGRIASLLEVGTGFHPELTGRENIYLNGAILGMSKEEIRRKFDEIVNFAEIEKFIDTPVKRYSSGMYVRLAFAIAAHLEPEILLVDEVLAVGDAEFQKKCLGKMGTVAQEGRTILFVSHNMAAVENLCQRGIVLMNGQIVADDSISNAIKYYISNLLHPIVRSKLSARTDRNGDGRIRFTNFQIEDLDGNILQFVRSGMDVIFAFDYIRYGEQQLRNVDFGFSLHSISGELLFILYSSFLGVTYTIDQHVGTVRCKIKHFPLPHGKYILGARITVMGHEADYPLDGVAEIRVEEGDFYNTGRTQKGYTKQMPKFLLNGYWSINE